MERVKGSSSDRYAMGSGHIAAELPSPAEVPRVCSFCGKAMMPTATICGFCWRRPVGPITAQIIPKV